MNKEIHVILQSDRCWAEKSGKFRVEDNGMLLYKRIREGFGGRDFGVET